MYARIIPAWSKISSLPSVGGICSTIPRPSARRYETGNPAPTSIYSTEPTVFWDGLLCLWRWRGIETRGLCGSIPKVIESWWKLSIGRRKTDVKSSFALLWNGPRLSASSHCCSLARISFLRKYLGVWPPWLNIVCHLLLIFLIVIYDVRSQLRSYYYIVHKMELQVVLLINSF